MTIKEMNINGEPWVPKGSSVAPDFDNLEVQIGWQYVIETPTKYWVGTLAKETDEDFILVDVAWIQDTGRFNEYLATGATKNMEPAPAGMPLFVAKGAKCVMYPAPKIKIQLV